MSSGLGYRRIQPLTWVVLLETGEVHVGIEHRGDGGEFSQLLVFLPALQAPLVVREPVGLPLCGGRGGRGCCRAAGPGALGLTLLGAEEAAPFPEDKQKGVNARQATWIGRSRGSALWSGQRKGCVGVRTAPKGQGRPQHQAEGSNGASHLADLGGSSQMPEGRAVCMEHLALGLLS